MTVLARLLALWVGASFLTCICLAYLGYRRNSNREMTMTPLTRFGPQQGGPAEHCGHEAMLPVSQVATECVLRPGHNGSHANHEGARWWLAQLDVQPSAAAGSCLHCGRGDAEPAADRTLGLLSEAVDWLPAGSLRDRIDAALNEPKEPRP